MANVTKENANLILEKYLEDHGISKAFDADFAFKVSKVLGISPTIFLSSSYTKSLK